MPEQLPNNPDDVWDKAGILLSLLLGYLVLAGLIAWLGAIAAMLVFPLAILGVIFVVVITLHHVKKHPCCYLLLALGLLAVLGFFLADQPAWFWQAISQAFRRWQTTCQSPEGSVRP